VQREIEKLVVRFQAQAVGKLNEAEELAAQAWQREVGAQSEPDANAPEAKRQAGQTSPGNRITNLPRLYGCVMRLSLSDKCPQPYRLATQGAQNSVPWPLCGLSPTNKTSTPKLKCETLEISLVFINPWFRVLLCNVIHRQSSTCRCNLKWHRLIIFGTFVRY